MNDFVFVRGVVIRCGGQQATQVDSGAGARADVAYPRRGRFDHLRLHGDVRSSTGGVMDSFSRASRCCCVVVTERFQLRQGRTFVLLTLLVSATTPLRMSSSPSLLTVTCSEQLLVTWTGREVDVG